MGFLATWYSTVLVTVVSTVWESIFVRPAIPSVVTIVHLESKTVPFAKILYSSLVIGLTAT